ALEFLATMVFLNEITVSAHVELIPTGREPGVALFVLYAMVEFSNEKCPNSNCSAAVLPDTPLLLLATVMFRKTNCVVGFDSLITMPLLPPRFLTNDTFSRTIGEVGVPFPQQIKPAPPLPPATFSSKSVLVIV